MGLFNAAYDAADNIKTTKDQENKKKAVKALAQKKMNEKQQKKDSFSLF